VIVSPEHAQGFQLPPDAWAVLVAAFIGAIVSLVAVFIQQVLQNRNSRIERDKRNRAVARAILLEINDFYKWHVEALAGVLKDADATSHYYFAKIEKRSFPVYQNNSGTLGYLPEEVATQIVQFYGTAEGFLDLLNNYAELIDRVELGTELTNMKKLADIALADIRKTLPDVQRAMLGAGETICKYTGISFTPPRVQ